MNAEAQGSNKLISIVIPVFNEQDNVEMAYAAIKELFETLTPQYRFEIIFTDNHSSDDSFAIIERLAKADSRVRGVRFVRNFGFHRSVLTGLRLAIGDAAVQIDCDLQDPPATIADFIKEWELGHDVVVGVRRTRDDGQSHRLARRIFYRVLTRISHDSIVADSGDFRLLDRNILNQLRDIHETSPYLRGLTSSLAARQQAVLYDRQMRRRGKSKFPLSRLIGLALDAIFAHSTVPLRLATYAGLVIAFVTFLLSAAYALGRIFFNLDWPAGFATTTVLLLFGISLNAIFLGIIGEYIGRIYNQVRFRPTTVIERSINLGESLRLGATQLSPHPISSSPFGNMR
jgi:polyisoprenyl-phosphate glycosyltransferase